MNDYLQENKRTLFILFGLLFILAIVLYFILLRPLIADLSSKERAIQNIENEIQLLETKLTSMSEEIKETDVEQLVLENKIPPQRDLDEYILSLQRLEAMTGSKIAKINFVYDSNLDKVEDEEKENTDTKSETDEDEEGNEVEITIDPIILNEKPENLHVMTVKVVGASPDFNEFINLLEVIENQERISIVSKLKFIKQTEYEQFFEDDYFETILFEAELSTFYYEE